MINEPEDEDVEELAEKAEASISGGRKSRGDLTLKLMIFFTVVPALIIHQVAIRQGIADRTEVVIDLSLLVATLTVGWVTWRRYLRRCADQLSSVKQLRSRHGL